MSIEYVRLTYHRYDTNLWKPMSHESYILAYVSEVIVSYLADRTHAFNGKTAIIYLSLALDVREDKATAHQSPSLLDGTVLPYLTAKEKTAHGRIPKPPTAIPVE